MEEKRTERTVYQLNDGEDMDSPVKCSFSAGEIYDAICDASEDYTQDFDAIEEDLDYDPYDAEYKSRHEWNVYAYPESMIDEIDEDGIAWLKDDQNVDYEKAHCGRIFVETQFTEESQESEKSLSDQDIEDFYITEDYSDDFAKEVQKERPGYRVSTHETYLEDPDGLTFTTDELSKAGFNLADEKEKDSQKEKAKSKQTER